MGYSTAYFGQLTIEPALSTAWVNYLNAFADTRHMRLTGRCPRDMKEPLRAAVKLPWGLDGDYCVCVPCGAVVNPNRPPRTQPGLWCNWRPTPTGQFLQWNGCEKFYDGEAWLRYIVTNFLLPTGRKLTGHVTWQGDHPHDFGVLRAWGGYVWTSPHFRDSRQLVTPAGVRVLADDLASIVQETIRRYDVETSQDDRDCDPVATARFHYELTRILADLLHVSMPAAEMPAAEMLATKQYRRIVLEHDDATAALRPPPVRRRSRRAGRVAGTGHLPASD